MVIAYASKASMERLNGLALIAPSALVPLILLGWARQSTLTICILGQSARTKESVIVHLESVSASLDMKVLLANVPSVLTTATIKEHVGLRSYLPVRPVVCMMLHGTP
jgi:hypothetical protein